MKPIRTQWLMLALLCISCAGLPFTSPPRSFPSSGFHARPEVIDSRILNEDGGYLDWCGASDTLAFARRSDRGRVSEIYTARPDGSEERCLTCDNPAFARGPRHGAGRDRGQFFRGNPAWHPSCEYLVIQVGNRQFRGSRYERDAFGINNELWLLAADGSWAEPLVRVEENEAAIGPSFSDDGTRLVWSSRRNTEKEIARQLTDPTPGRQDPWDGWWLSVADFSRADDGPGELAHRVDLFGEDGGWLGASAITHDSVWFSGSPREQWLSDEIYRADHDGSGREELLRSPGTWEEQPLPSPGGALLGYRSSRPYGWSRPPHPIGTLRLELWAMTAGGERVALTEYSKTESGPDRRFRALVQDFAWSPDGREVAVFVLQYEMGAKPRRAIEILTLNDAF